MWLLFTFQKFSYSIKCLTMLDLPGHCISIVIYISHASFSEEKSLYRWYNDITDINIWIQKYSKIKILLERIIRVKVSH